MEKMAIFIPGAELLQSALDMLIFKAISLGPLNDYGIGQRIVQMSDALGVEDRSLYPLYPAFSGIERQRGG
jgi:hypothetical protein